MCVCVLLLPGTAYVQAGLTNKFCLRVIVVIFRHKTFRKTFQTGDLEVITIAKQDCNN